MFANSQMMGLDLAFPDVCLTPTPVPVPIPYPDIGLSPIYLGFVPNILYGGTPSHNLMSMAPVSMGDFGGVALGVASGTVMGPTRHLTAAFTVLTGGLPTTRMTSVSLQNSTNMVGMRIVLSQPKVLLLAP